MNEMRYQFILMLYLIRKQYPRMGLFQPDFIYVIFRSLMPSKYHRTDADIKIAVNEWCDNPVTATVMYGHISKWNTFRVTNMNKLFKYKRDFNDDISKWNVSSVIDMHSMFYETPFNGDISKWNVSNVIDMCCMFKRSSFNSNISEWNVSNVIDMNGMFRETQFDHDISKWDVSNTNSMLRMFLYCPITNEHKPIITRKGEVK